MNTYGRMARQPRKIFEEKSKLKLVKIIQEKEKRGWDCIHPIKERFIDLCNAEKVGKKYEFSFNTGMVYYVTMELKPR